MGEHSAADSGTVSKVRDAAGWVWRNRRKLAAAAIVALPFVARFVPGFPADEAVRVLRGFLGA